MVEEYSDVIRQPNLQYLKLDIYKLKHDIMEEKAIKSILKSKSAYSSSSENRRSGEMSAKEFYILKKEKKIKKKKDLIVDEKGRVRVIRTIKNNDDIVNNTVNHNNNTHEKAACTNVLKNPHIPIENGAVVVNNKNMDQSKFRCSSPRDQEYLPIVEEGDCIVNIDISQTSNINTSVSCLKKILPFLTQWPASLLHGRGENPLEIPHGNPHVKKKSIDSTVVMQTHELLLKENKYGTRRNLLRNYRRPVEHPARDVCISIGSKETLAVIMTTTLFIVALCLMPIILNPNVHN